MDEQTKCDPYADFMDALFHCDTVTVSLKGIGATEWDTETIHKAILHRVEHTHPAASAWRTDAPPMDGTWVLRFTYGSPDGLPVVVRHIIGHDRRKTGWFDSVGRKYPYSEFLPTWAAINPYKGVE